jgi:RNA polymerase sigma-70 factor (ECF subfamily)
MLRAWRARNELRNSTALRPWLLTIVRRENARLHERKRLPMVDLDEVVASQDIALGLNDAGPEIADLRRAILALPDEYREPIVLQVLGGFSTGEIAKELGLTVPAVLTRLFRARNKLREMYGVGPESPGETP